MKSPAKKAALLIEDKSTMLAVRTALECAGFQCEGYTSMISLLRSARRDDHAAIIVDTSQADVDCGALVAWRRNWLGSELPVIALGPRDALCAASNLDLGIDDFVARPIRGPELLARLGAALRRRRPAESVRAPSVAGCMIDPIASAIVSTSWRVALTSRELALAQVLFENVGQLVTRTRLARDVWGQGVELTGRSLEQHIHQLRRKLKRCAGEAMTLRGVYGSGYRIDVAGDGPTTMRPQQQVAAARLSQERITHQPRSRSASELERNEVAHAAETPVDLLPADRSCASIGR